MSKYSLNEEDATQVMMYVVDSMLWKAIQEETFLIITGDDNKPILVFYGMNYAGDKQQGVHTAIKTFLDNVSMYQTIHLNYCDEDFITFTRED